MAYNFNPHRHVKIWLSKDPHTFLNLENRIRLAKLRELNPSDEINLIYDSRLLSAAAIKALKDFCLRYQIADKDVPEVIIPQCQTALEERLIEIYEDEIFHLEGGGNLGVASDILRWLKPVYELGTYTDFDVKVDTQNFPSIIPVEQPLLMNLGSGIMPDGYEAVCINNDTIAVVDSQAAAPLIEKIQQTLKNNCSKQSAQKNCIADSILSYQQRLFETFPFALATLLVNEMPDGETLLTLKDLSCGKTMREVRKAVLDYTESNLIYSKKELGFLGNTPDLPGDECIRQKAEEDRAELKKELSWTSWLFLPKNQYKELQSLASIKDNDEFLTQIRKRHRRALCQGSIVNTSGPDALIHALFPALFYKKDIIDQHVATFSFAHYGLNQAFITENGLPLHAEAKLIADLENKKIGEVNDLAWLQEGADAVRLREEKILKAQAKMPQDLHDIRTKIEVHIQKIQTDLKGIFGFYRHNDRNAKIKMLQEILGYFKHSCFDLRGFKTTLANYHSKNVSASMRDSKTKQLIDELDRFSQCANDYLLTNEQGKVEILPPTHNCSLGLHQ
ncbi:MAG: hypothetical protein H2069_00765 [Legionella sp.]|nr:hypothetical protein [Legionella sp.]